MPLTNIQRVEALRVITDVGDSAGPRVLRGMNVLTLPRGNSLQKDDSYLGQATGGMVSDLAPGAIGIVARVLGVGKQQ